MSHSLYSKILYIQEIRSKIYIKIYLKTVILHKKSSSTEKNITKQKQYINYNIFLLPSFVTTAVSSYLRSMFSKCLYIFYFIKLELRQNT